MTVLVTGAAGFIGNRVSEMLMQRGYEVSGIDNMCSHGYDSKFKEQRFYKKNPNPGDTVFTRLLHGHKLHWSGCVHRGDKRNKSDMNYKNGKSDMNYKSGE